MKFTFVVNQLAAVEAGLVGKITVADLCFLNYLRGWFFSKNAKLQIVNGSKFVWLHYERAVQELPLLFNPDAQITSNKNRVCHQMEKLRNVDLVETIPVGRRLFFRLTGKAVEITKPRQGRTQGSVRKPTSTVAPPRDETVTPKSDGNITPSDDDLPPANIYENGIKEIGRMETPPQSPKGDCVLGTGVISSREEEIFEAYPKKVSKLNAFRVIRRALAKYPFDFLLERTRLYARTCDFPAEFIPNPSTWFNQERFNDDPSTWRRTTGTRCKPQPAIIRPDKFGCGVSKL